MTSTCLKWCVLYQVIKLFRSFFIPGEGWMLNKNETVTAWEKASRVFSIHLKKWGQWDRKRTEKVLSFKSYSFLPTEEDTWMVIQHNNSELTRVRPSPGVNTHSIHFDYSTREEQLLAAISQSEHCEQELSYHCKKSRLLNTPGKFWTPFSNQPPSPSSWRSAEFLQQFLY